MPPAGSLAAVALAIANMLPRLGGPALLLLLLGAGVSAEVLFRCPPCTAGRVAACETTPTRSGAPCTELVREPGCGCCSVCARLEGEACGVYTPRCAQGLRCYPHPDSELPLQALVQGAGTCEKRRDADYGASSEQVAGNARAGTTSWEKLGGQRGMVGRGSLGWRPFCREGGCGRPSETVWNRVIGPSPGGLLGGESESQARGGDLEFERAEEPGY